MFKIYTDKEQFKFCSELIILGGLLDNIQDKDKLRMDGLIEFCNNNIEYITSIKNCDLVVLPYKFKGSNDKYMLRLCKKAKQYNKKVYGFYIDDNNSKFELPENFYLYRTSVSQADLQNNERSIMPLIDDVFNGHILENPVLSIGFCGQINCGRKKYIEYFLKSNLKTDFKLRKVTYFSHHYSLNKELSREDFFNNIRNNIFTFCYRGYGNYSYRLYEVLMMGRIPILINTDCVIPFLNEALADGMAIILINEEDLLNNVKSLEDEINNYYQKHKGKLEEQQKMNRQIYEKYYKYSGFITQIIKNV